MVPSVRLFRLGASRWPRIIHFWFLMVHLKNATCIGCVLKIREGFRPPHPHLFFKDNISPVWMHRRRANRATATFFRNPRCRRPVAWERKFLGYRNIDRLKTYRKIKTRALVFFAKFARASPRHFREIPQGDL